MHRPKDIITDGIARTERKKMIHKKRAVENTALFFITGLINYGVMVTVWLFSSNNTV